MGQDVLLPWGRCQTSQWGCSGRCLLFSRHKSEHVTVARGRGFGCGLMVHAIVSGSAISCCSPFHVTTLPSFAPSPPNDTLLLSSYPFQVAYLLWQVAKNHWWAWKGFSLPTGNPSVCYSACCPKVLFSVATLAKCTFPQCFLQCIRLGGKSPTYVPVRFQRLTLKCKLKHI